MVSALALVKSDVKQRPRKVTGRRIQAHSNNGGTRNHVTKVLDICRTSWVAGLCVLAFILPRAYGADSLSAKPAESLYLQLGQVGLDPSRVYQVRGASLDRPSIHITLEDGTIAFTQDVFGRVTGAFFEGEGEILLIPPNEVERKSMSLFTGMAILEERFATAYFRFNDDVMIELQPDLRSRENPQEFVDHASFTAKNLAGVDAMRLLVSFSHMLPRSDGEVPKAAQPVENRDRFLHARLQGTKLGVFDVYFDSTAVEQVLAGQAKPAENGETYYDIWTSFLRLNLRHAPVAATQPNPRMRTFRRTVLQCEATKSPPKSCLQKRSGRKRYYSV